MVRIRLTSALLQRAALSLWLAGCGVCGAQEIPNPPLSFGAFGTFGVTYQNAPGLEYRRSVTEATGARTGEVDFETDSMFGLEGTASLNRTVRLFVEGITSLNERGNWDPRLERALIAYTPDESVELRAGRIGFDTYPLAESPEVRYTLLPIRPAPEIFGLFDTDHFDGLDATARTSIREGVASLRLLAGHADGRFASADGRFSADDATYLGGQLSYSWGPWLGRAGYLRVIDDTLADLSGLENRLRDTQVPQSIALADRLQHRGRGTDGIQFAVAYDWRPLQMQLLLTHIDSSFADGPRVDVGLLTAGYEIVSSLTPYVSYADARSFAKILPTGLPATPVYSQLNSAALDVQLASQITQRTLSAGVRLEISRHFDLKAQADYVQSRDSALIFNTTDAPHQATHLLLFGLALDCVF